MIEYVSSYLSSLGSLIYPIYTQTFCFHRAVPLVKGNECSTLV